VIDPDTNAPGAVAGVNRWPVRPPAIRPVAAAAAIWAGAPGALPEVAPSSAWAAHPQRPRTPLQFVPRRGESGGVSVGDGGLQRPVGARPRVAAETGRGAGRPAAFARLTDRGRFMRTGRGGGAVMTAQRASARRGGANSARRLAAIVADRGPLVRRGSTPHRAAAESTGASADDRPRGLPPLHRPRGSTALAEPRRGLLKPQMALLRAATGPAARRGSLGGRRRPARRPAGPAPWSCSTAKSAATSAPRWTPTASTCAAITDCRSNAPHREPVSWAPVRWEPAVRQPRGRFGGGLFRAGPAPPNPEGAERPAGP